MVRLVLLSLLLTSFLFAEEAFDQGLNRMTFSSYGRIMASIDPSTGDLVSGTAIDGMVQRSNKASFTDLSFTYTPYLDKNGGSAKIVHTSSFFYDPTWMAAFNHNIDNLYVEFNNLMMKGLRFWGGRRIFKGNSNNYLYDYWPIEFIPVMGGGVGYTTADGKKSIDYMLSFQRLNQTGRSGHMSLIKYHQTLSPKYTFHVYGEFRTAEEFIDLGPDGNPGTPDDVKFDNDFGWAIGGEFDLNNPMPNSYIKLFLRVSGGLSAYERIPGTPDQYNDDPLYLNEDGKSIDTIKVVFSIDSAFDTKDFGIRFGTYVQYFNDGLDPVGIENDGIRASYMMRFHYYMGKHFRPGIELAHHFSKIKEGDLAQQFKISLAPELVTQKGLNGLLPRIRMIYTLSILNDEAKGAGGDNIQHYLGIGSQWLFF